MEVTVVSCLYGDGFEEFVQDWACSVAALDPQPDRVIVGTDRPLNIDGAAILAGDCPWRYPQAFYLQLAISAVDTEWVWILDIDDLAMSDALEGLDEVFADVWQMGFLRSDGELYVPPRLTAAEYLGSPRNVYTASSAFRTEAFRQVGGFKDVALQDWSLWRRITHAGLRFEPSGRAHYHYMRHRATRGDVELTMDARPTHLVEMLDVEQESSFAA